MWRERGLTLVIVTHDSSVARRAAPTAVMRNGLLTLAASDPARHTDGSALPSGPRRTGWSSVCYRGPVAVAAFSFADAA
jgi:hypothetical protein